MWCMLMPQIIPLIALMLVCIWYEESDPGFNDGMEMLPSIQIGGEFFCLIN